MTLKNNPFTSDTFLKVWKRHFVKEGRSFSHDFIDIAFNKPYSVPLYTNVGSTLTKGISYELFPEEKVKDLKNKAFLIYDVPEFFQLSNDLPKGIKLLKVKQYPGYLIQLNKYENLNDYLSKTFSKSSQQKFNRYQQRLEQCFNIKYKVYYGDITKEDYEKVFTSFHDLLTKRFDDKQTINNNLFDHEWNFYHDVVYQMILEKKASLYVIYSGNNPISVRLNYYSNKVVFDAITVFDIDYSKFHLGKISIMKALEWAFENNYEKFDFSKGYFDYKESWGDLKYNFEYHILYHSRSIVSVLIGHCCYYAYKLKQYLRDQRLNDKLHKLTYFFKNKKREQTKITEVSPDNFHFSEENLVEINTNDHEVAYLRKEIYDFIYVAKEPIDNLKVYTWKQQDKNLFLLKTHNSEKLFQLN